jgi:phospholipid/cholesterol/gamma-HCH transport system substrate-binding protein
VPFLKGSDIFSNQKRVYVVYDKVDGVGVANPVVISGLKVGHIEKIGFSKSRVGKILITLLIDKNAEVPKNSTATIVNADLLGSKAIELTLSNERILIDDNDTLLSGGQTSVFDQVGPLKDKTEKLINSLNSVLENLQGALGKDKLSKTLDHFQSVSANLDNLVASQQVRLDNIFSNVESISKNLKNGNDNISKILKNFAQVSDSLAKANIATTIKNANKALEQASIVIKKINDGKGTLGMLVNNDSLYVNLNSSARDLDKLIVDLKENPGRYVTISIFGGKSKKVKK